MKAFLGESLSESDVDLLVDFNCPITIFDLVAVQHYLEACLDGRNHEEKADASQA